MVELKSIIILVMYAIAINLLMINFTSIGIGINCPNLQTTYTYKNITFQNHSVELGYGDILDLATGRCEGLPFWLVLVFELPILVGLFFIMRSFIGWT